MKCKMRRHCDQSSVDCKRRRHWAQSSMNCKMRRHCDQSSVNCKMWRQDKSRVDCKTRRHCDQLSVNYKIWCHWDQSSVNCKMQRHCDAFSRHFRCQNIDCTPFGNLSLELGGSWLLQIFFTNPLINLTAQLVESVFAQKQSVADCSEVECESNDMLLRRSWRVQYCHCRVAMFYAQ